MYNLWGNQQITKTMSSTPVFKKLLYPWWMAVAGPVALVGTIGSLYYIKQTNKKFDFTSYSNSFNQRQQELEENETEADNLFDDIYTAGGY
jgi:hypothetical protein